MCRNIKTLHNFEPPATSDEIAAAALQFVRKISGTRKPSKANAAAFSEACETISAASNELLMSLVTTSAPKNREAEAEKVLARNRQRFGRR